MAYKPNMSVAPKMTPKPLLPATPLMSTQPPTFKTALGVNTNIPRPTATPTPATPVGPTFHTALGANTGIPKPQTMTPVPPRTTAPNMSVANGPAQPMLNKPPVAPGQPTAPYGGTLNPNDPASIGGRADEERRLQELANRDPEAADKEMDRLGYTGSPNAPERNPKTSDGYDINPATGGVKKPSAAEEAAAKAAETYKTTLTQTPEEIAAQKEADTLAESYGLSRNENQNRAVAMPFITGAAANLERSYNLNAGTLEQRMARLQASRIAAGNVSKFALERADKAVEREQTVADDEKKAKREGSFTLGEGQQRYDAEGNLVASGPDKPKGASAFKFQKVGNDLFRVEDDGSLTKVTPQEVQENKDVLAQQAMDALNTIATFDEQGNVTLSDEAERAIGKSSIFNFIPGTAGATGMELINNLKSNLTLSMIPYLKGTGAISDKEGEILASAVAALKTNMKPDAFKAQLQKVRQNLTEALAKSAAENIDTSDPDFQALRNDPDLGDKTDEEIWEALGKPKVGSGTNNAQLRVKLPSGKTHEGGSASWRNNNPLNIKNGQFASKYGAAQGSAATDGGNFAAFPSVEAGMKAARDLLRASSYTTLPLEQAMRRWSGNGYGADVAPANLRNKKTGQMTDAELNTLIEYMRKREGWKEGKIYA